MEPAEKSIMRLGGGDQSLLIAASALNIFPSLRNYFRISITSYLNNRHIYLSIYLSIYLILYWDCRIYRLLLCRGVIPPHNECPVYDTKQSDDEIPVMLELWEMQSTPSLLSLLGPLWPGGVAPDKGPIYELD